MNSFSEYCPPLGTGRRSSKSIVVVPAPDRRTSGSRSTVAPAGSTHSKRNVSSRPAVCSSTRKTRNGTGRFACRMSTPIAFITFNASCVAHRPGYSITFAQIRNARTYTPLPNSITSERNTARRAR